jgi:hypothetical protein
VYALRVGARHKTFMALAMSLAMTACATTGSNNGSGGSDVDDTCGAIILGVIAIPCAIAWGTGCVVGGCTACYEHQSQGAPADPDTSTAPAEVAPAKSGDDDANGAQRVAF